MDKYNPKHIASINIDASGREGMDVWVHRANGKMKRYRRHLCAGKQISESSVHRAQRAQIALALR